ncbi:hypothetical protein [Shinella zoogloeoides]|uniref:hypothetical protein n=1 Tax=Shinella zoogloeoides TaxID=352475 RepID=UPI001F572543|nr:hypothetical protein [Shinella zoogloeoides]
MSKRTIKGVLTNATRSTVQALADFPDHAPPSTTQDILGFDPSKLGDWPLLLNSVPLIRREFFRQARPATINKIIKNLRKIAQFVIIYSNESGRLVTHVRNIDGNFRLAFHKRFREDVDTVRVFNRLVKCLGGEKEQEVPTLPTAPNTAVRELLESREIQRVLKIAKSEVLMLLRRQAEVAAALDRPFDFTLRGNWQLLEKRVWSVKNVLQLQMLPWNELNRRYPMVVKGLEKHFGAEGFTPDGTIVRRPGLNGHLLYFYPEGRDLAPFIIIVMLRTGFNLSALGTMKAEQWYAPYPFSSPPGSKDGICYIIAQKHRGNRRKGESPRTVRAISLMTPYSHAYQLLKFVENATKQTRLEIKRQIDLLRDKISLSSKEKSTLKYYETIKDHVFVYRSEGKFYSIVNEKGDPRRFLSDALEHYGISRASRSLRDAHLNSGLVSPGGSFAVIKLLASHSERIVAYERRKQTLERAETTLIAVFEKSIELIKLQRYSITALKRELSHQGFSLAQSASVLDPGTTTVWGNRCADPTFPPPEFRDGATTGRPCVGQRCIDGCPFARWFPDAAGHLQAIRAQLQREISALGYEATMGSSHHRRLRAVDHILLELSEHAERQPS